MDIEVRKARTAKFRNTEEWERIRLQILERAEGRCECPGGYENGGETGSTRCENRVHHIHHLVYPIIPSEIALDKLMGLCQVCHATRHEANSVLETLPCCRYVHRRNHE